MTTLYCFVSYFFKKILLFFKVITASLSEFCHQYAAQHQENQSAGWLSSLTNMVGSMFVSEEGGVRTQQIR